jgi:hypothetical protein
MVHPATLADLRDALSIRQAQELVDGGAVFTTGDQLTAAWGALGDRLAEQVWIAVAADNRALAYAELVLVERVLMLRLWSLPDHHDVGLATVLIAKAEDRACIIGREDSADSIRLFAQATSSHPEMREALAQADFALLSTYEKMELSRVTKVFRLNSGS